MSQGNGHGGGPPAAAASMEEYSQLMMTRAQTMAMQSAIGSVPPFDGTNLPLKNFIQDVRNAAADIADEQLPCFLKKVLTKRLPITVSQLHELRMKQGDTVGDFRDRLNILLMEAENALKEDKGATYTNDMMTPMKEAAIDNFIRGLPGNISAAVDASHPADLESAYKEAVRIEARIRSGILPDSRQSAQLGHYAEQNELSQNLRACARFYPNFMPGTINRNQSQDGAGSSVCRLLRNRCCR